MTIYANWGTWSYVIIRTKNSYEIYVTTKLEYSEKTK